MTGGGRMRFTIRQVEGVPGQSRYVLTRGNESAGSIGRSERTIPGSLLYDVSVCGISWQMRMPSAVELAEAIGTGETPVLLLGPTSRDGFIPTGRIGSHDEPDGLVGRIEFYELDIGRRQYRAFPVARGGRYARLPIYEVRDAETGELGDQVAFAECGGASVRTPKAYNIASVDERSAVVGVLFACYECHLSYLEQLEGGRPRMGGGLRLLGGGRAAKLDDPSFEERVGE